MRSDESGGTGTWATRTTARTVIGLYEADGMKALCPKPGGVSPGQGRFPTFGQGKILREAVRDRRPDQLKLDFALWPRKAVRELIWQKFRIRMNSISKYLKRWGHTSQSPMRTAYGQNPKAVQKWLDEEYNTLP